MARESVNRVSTSRSSYGAIVRGIECGLPLDQPLAVSSSGSDGQVDRVSLSFPTLPPCRQNAAIWFGRFHEVINDARAMGMVENAIVHGSFGDFTATPFSDLEVTLVLPDATLQRQDKAAQLGRWIKGSLNPFVLSVDPLQHHGAFYIWPSLCNSYSESILPLAAYESSWAVVEETLTFRVMPRERDVSYDLLVKTLTAIRNHERAFFRRGTNPYSIKRLLSNIMLVPALVWQSKGVIASKKEAIRRIRIEAVSPIDEVLDRCSDLRDNWPVPPKILGQLRTLVNKGSIPSGRMDVLMASLYRDRKLSDQIARYLVPKLPEFCDAVENLAEIRAHR